MTLLLLKKEKENSELIDTRLSMMLRPFESQLPPPPPRPALRSIKAVLCCIRIPIAVLKLEPEFETVRYNFLSLVSDTGLLEDEVFRGLKGSLISQNFCVCLSLKTSLCCQTSKHQGFVNWEGSDTTSCLLWTTFYINCDTRNKHCTAIVIVVWKWVSGCFCIWEI